jgi:Carbohydrate esterase, sialic acid-specific acetylesterase
VIDSLPDRGCDVWLLAGQSNIVGGHNAGRDPSLDGPVDRVWQYTNLSADKPGTIRPAVEPLAHRRAAEPDSIGHGVAFARALLPCMPADRGILLVPCGYSGSGMTTSSHPSPPQPFRWDPRRDAGSWDPQNGGGGVSLLEAAIHQTNAALETHREHRLGGVLWHQGEADIWHLGRREYAARLDACIDRFRSQITGASEETPVLVGSMLPEFVSMHRFTAAGVDAAHRDTPRRRPGTALYGLPSGHGAPDRIHYTAEGQRLLGAAAAKALCAARGNTPGSTNRQLDRDSVALVLGGVRRWVRIHRPRLRRA